MVHKPPLPRGALLSPHSMQEFLLTKVINAQEKAMHSRDFAPALKRTREQLLKALISEAF